MDIILHYEFNSISKYCIIVFTVDNFDNCFLCIFQRYNYFLISVKPEQ